MNKEKLTTTLLGSLAMIFFMYVFFDVSGGKYTDAFFHFGVSCTFFGLAFSPDILFKKIKLEEIKSGATKQKISGLSALFVFLGNAGFVFGMLFWLFK